MATTSSPSLPKLQSWMKGVLTHPNGARRGLQLHPRYRHSIEETPAVSREKRLSIYGDGYFYRLVDCMAANFNSLRNTIGEVEFNKLARAYLIKHPSTFKCIDDVGHKLSDFLKKYPLTKKYPFLPDYAALEWATHQSFYADDIPLFDTAKLKNIPESSWPKAVITLDPSVKLLTLSWPLDELWRVDGKWNAQKVKRIKTQQVKLLVYRQTDKLVRAPRINEIQFSLLMHLSKGTPLGKTLLFISKKFNPGVDGETLQSWFQNWIGNGVIKGVLL